MCPSSSSARLAITSLAFMFVDVPAPPWMTSTTNWSCSAPERISVQAVPIASAICGGEQPEVGLARAAACFTAASASTRCG